MKQLIYIADDEKNIRELIRDFLKNDDYEVMDFENGDSLYEVFLKKEPDLIILDIMMPGMDGLTLCRKIRETSRVPIIMLTAKDSELDYVQGISVGSDDYLTKPFRPTVLLMRVRALLRRVEMDSRTQQKKSADDLQLGNLEFRRQANAVFCGGKEIPFTPTELKMLIFMMESPEKSFSREELLNKIWGYESEVETRVTDETMRRIRRKLSETGSQISIQTVWGFGYRLKKKES